MENRDLENSEPLTRDEAQGPEGPAGSTGPALRSLAVRHIVPSLGRVPRDLATEGVSGLVGTALGLARAQRARGYRVELHGWRPDPGPRGYELDGIGVRVTPGWWWARTPTIDGRVVAPLLALSARSRPVDIVHVHVEPHLLLAPRGSGYVLHHNTPIPEQPLRFYQRLVARARLVVCCSDFTRRQFLARVDYPPEQTVVIPNGIDAAPAEVDAGPAERSRLGIEPDEVVVLFVGAIVPEKGLLQLLQAIGSLQPRFPRLHLLVAGGAALWATSDDPAPTGADAYSTAVRAAAAGLRVTWLGVVPKARMRRLYGVADIFAFPSIWDEPFGMVNVEAMAAGLPVVASTVGAVPEIVVDGETGLLAPRGDVAAFAAALAALIDDPERRARLGRAGRAHADCFAWSRAAARLDGLYRELLDRAARPRRSRAATQ